MKRIFKGEVVAAFILLSALCIYFYKQMDFQYRLIAVSWGDGAYGKALYGAYVYLGEEKENQVEVKAKIYIGRGSYLTNYPYDLGVIGLAKDDIEAVKHWGTITWKPEGVEFGGEIGKPYVVSRQDLEKHR